MEIKFEFHYMISLFLLILYTSSHHVELATHILILRRYELQVLASLTRNSYQSFKYDVESFARIMVRALHADQTFGSIDDKFGKFKTSMLLLLAERANSPAREKGCAVANCALAHLMKPGVDTPLYNLIDSFNIEIIMHECLAANTLNMTIDEVKKLPKFQLPNAVTVMHANPALPTKQK